MGDCTLCFQNQADNTNYCYIAAFNNHIECLKYAHQEGCDLDLNVCIISICKGNLQCLEYAHKNGGEMFVYSCEMAARYGQLECLKYIFNNGGSINNACYWAAKYGHLNCLKYAHENGGTLGESVNDNNKILLAAYKIALKKNHYDCFQYSFNMTVPQSFVRTNNNTKPPLPLFSPSPIPFIYSLPASPLGIKLAPLITLDDFSDIELLEL